MIGVEKIVFIDPFDLWTLMTENLKSFTYLGVDFTRGGSLN